MSYNTLVVLYMNMNENGKINNDDTSIWQLFSYAAWILFSRQNTFNIIYFELLYIVLDVIKCETASMLQWISRKEENKKEYFNSLKSYKIWNLF